MKNPNATHPTSAPCVPAKHARRAAPARHARQAAPGRAATLLLALLCALFLASGCKKSQSDTAAPAAKTEAKKATTPTKAELDQLAREREAFGLPLPPDAIHINRTDAYVRANSFMKLAELEAFYKARLVDYEFLYPQSAIPDAHRLRELHIIGLRSFMPSITIRHTGGKHGSAELDFRPAQPPPAKFIAPEPSAAPSSQTPTPGIASEQRRREKGMPVLDRTPTGELLAPGARWGEPYTPPEGSPLHTKRNRANFGRPYGQWKTP